MNLFILLAFLTTSVFAAETNTECPWMREMNKRNNPKANLALAKVKPKTATTSGQ